MTIVYVIAAAAIIATLVALLVLFARSDDLSRAVLSDVLFYCAVGLFLLFSLSHQTSITYEVAMFAAVMGALSTVANARMAAGGQR